MRRGFILAFAVSLALLCNFASAGSVTVLPPHSSIDGKPLADYTADWWTQIYSIPNSQNPLNDTTGAITQAVGDHGDVFFLYGVSKGSATRSVTVHSNQYLFFPVQNFGIDNAGWLRSMTDAELTAAAKSYADTTTSLSATIDGSPVANLSSYREVSKPFVVPLIPDNFIGDPVGGTTRSVADGYWLALAPLPVGAHVLQFGGSFNGNIKLPAGVASAGPASIPVKGSVTTTYTVNVVPLPSAVWAALLALPAVAIAVRRMKQRSAT